MRARNVVLPALTAVVGVALIGVCGAVILVTLGDGSPIGEPIDHEGRQLAAAVERERAQGITRLAACEARVALLLSPVETRATARLLRQVDGFVDPSGDRWPLCSKEKRCRWLKRAVEIGGIPIPGPFCRIGDAGLDDCYGGKKRACSRAVFCEWCESLSSEDPGCDLKRWERTHCSTCAP